MATKPKREQRACINEWNRSAERRARQRGQKMVTARLGPVAYEKLMALCAEHECSVRDVIEGFLFGNIGRDEFARENRLSAAEVAHLREA